MQLRPYAWINCALTLACCGPIAGTDTDSSTSETGTSSTGGDLTNTTVSPTTEPPTTTVNPTSITITSEPTTVTGPTDPTTSTDPTATSNPTQPTTATTTDPSATDPSATDPSDTDTSTTIDPSDTDTTSTTGPVMTFSPLALEVEDFNGDGVRDLLVMGIDQDTQAVGRISLGVGDGTFLPEVDAGLAGASAFPVVGELDGTPGIDVMVAQDGGGAEVFRWDGAGFISWKLFDNANLPRTHVVADANGDDDDDIVWLWWTKNSLEFGLSIRPNGGGFFFAPVDTNIGVIADIGLAPTSLLVGKFNADGAADALVFEADKPKGFLRMFGSDPGQFSQPKFLLPELQPWVASLGDFDEDGDLDILVVERALSRLVVALGDGAGGFAMGPLVPIAGPFKPFTIAIADFDGNKHLDVAVIDDQLPELQVWSGKGDATFAGPVKIPLPSPAVRVVAAPLDGDAKSDLVAATFAAGDVTVLLSP